MDVAAVLDPLLDHQDAQKMFELLAESNSFGIHTGLINLNSGEVADESANVFCKQTIGESLIQGMAKTLAFNCKYRKKDMVITRNTNASVNIKGALSGLRQFLATESPLKIMKNAFYFTLFHIKALFVLNILSFCLDFLVMYRNGLIKKIRLISNFMTSQPG